MFDFSCNFQKLGYEDDIRIKLNMFVIYGFKRFINFIGLLSIPTELDLTLSKSKDNL